MTALRYARQYVLPEIGTTGQARIEATTFAPGGGESRATEVALVYLERAGMHRSPAGPPVDAPSAADVARIAGRPGLHEAAAFLAGALTATARIAAAAGVRALPVTSIPILSDDPS